VFTLFSLEIRWAFVNFVTLNVSEHTNMIIDSKYATLLLVCLTIYLNHASAIEPLINTVVRQPQIVRTLPKTVSFDEGEDKSAEHEHVRRQVKGRGGGPSELSDKARADLIRAMTKSHPPAVDGNHKWDNVWIFVYYFMTSGQPTVVRVGLNVQSVGALDSTNMVVSTSTLHLNQYQIIAISHGRLSENVMDRQAFGEHVGRQCGTVESIRHTFNRRAGKYVAARPVLCKCQIRCCAQCYNAKCRHMG
jgi:hypothetical protein